MPFETYFALVAFIGVFTIFGLSVAWAHWYTRATRKTFPKF